MNVGPTFVIVLVDTQDRKGIHQQAKRERELMCHLCHTPSTAALYQCAVWRCLTQTFAKLAGPLFPPPPLISCKPGFLTLSPSFLVYVQVLPPLPC